MKFHEILKKIREEFNSSTDSVAEYIGVSVAAYRYYERGERQPTFEALCKLADYFDVSTDYLLGRTDIRTPAFSDVLEALKVEPTTRKTVDDFDNAFKGLNPDVKTIIYQALIDINRTVAHKREPVASESKPKEVKTGSPLPSSRDIVAAAAVKIAAAEQNPVVVAKGKASKMFGDLTGKNIVAINTPSQTIGKTKRNGTRVTPKGGKK